MRVPAIHVIAVFALVASTAYAIKIQKREFDDRVLQQWYASYNEIIFGSELPSNTKVTWMDLSAVSVLDNPSHPMGMTIHDLGGKNFKIEIDKDYNPAEVTENETLIHEMCHVEVEFVEKDELENHGAKWQACMLRVAEHGGFADVW